MSTARFRSGERPAGPAHPSERHPPVPAPVPTVVIIGPQPPPIQGAALCNAEIADKLSPSAVVHRCTLSPRPGQGGLAYHATRFGRVLNAVAVLLRNARKAERCLYLTAGGGLGMIYNLPVLLAGQLCGYRRFIHHHSFAYLDHESGLMRILAGLAGRTAVHVCLCRRMADRLRARYGAGLRTLVLSNAVFFDHVPPPVRGEPGGPLRLGFMSNLMLEKGFDTVLELLRRLDPAGGGFRLVLGGPAPDAASAALLEQARAAFGRALDYRGPITDDVKAEFFRDVDVFVFPTRYVNEAQPRVVLEALTHGVPVIAYGRGCIGSDLTAPAGLVIEPGEDFIAAAEPLLRRLVADRGALARMAQAARERAAALNACGRTELQELLCLICGRPPPAQRVECRAGCGRRQ